MGGTPGSVDRKPHVDSKKPIKYPIEDLDLDPMSIHDGRILRRVNAELPTLPPKPTPSRELLVPPELFDTFIGTWNFLNVFSCVSPLFLTVPRTAADTYPTLGANRTPFALTNFSLDDFAGALHHRTLDPRCILLAEVHACLTNVIGTDPSRVLGTSGAFPGVLAPSPEDEGEEVSEEWQKEIELDKLIRRGIAYSRRWDRTAKLKGVDGRDGWERHMIGALCQVRFFSPALVGGWR